MDRKEFEQYIYDNFNIGVSAERLISNILVFVEKNYAEENQQYLVLCELLNGTIGLTDNEIKKVYM